MNIPTIGGARGIFEIFVPGMFLLLNLGAVVYLFPFIDDEAKRFIMSVASNPVLVLIIAVGFGYLIGVLLRLFPTDSLDKWSARCLRYNENWSAALRRQNDEFELYAYENFPYIGWIAVMCKEYLPPEAQAFYKDVWAERGRTDYPNKQFFNYCKTLINCIDERAANEIYAAESLTRYISGMFYALALSFMLILFMVFFRCFFASGQTITGPIIFLLAYSFIMVEILKHFRFIRIKEVETVFTTSFKNREIFEQRSSERLGFERVRDFDWSTAVINEDERRAYPERRFVAVGYLDGRLHVLCFTPITGGIRVISFRKANTREARKYGKPITFD